MVGRATMLLLCVAPIFGSAASAQRATRRIAGQVLDGASGAPIRGALVSGGERSTETDASGRFELAVPGDLRDVVILADGFATHLLQLEDGAVVDLRVTLARLGEGSSETIEIHGRDPASPEPVSYELTPELIRKVPGSGNDALRSLQTLPGVARVPFGMVGSPGTELEFAL